jgi:fluoroacetyl-CoA thioesterase
MLCLEPTEPTHTVFYGGQRRCANPPLGTIGYLRNYAVTVTAIAYPVSLSVTLTPRSVIEPGDMPVHHVATMIDLSRITPGLTGSADSLVTPDQTAPFVGSGRIAVLATPVMINLIEAAALAAVEHLLPAGHQSLGIHLDVKHVAATPVGLRVTATAEVLRVEGRTITFRVEARDEREPIGGGTHQRVVVSVARFDERVQRKLHGAS